MSELNQQTNYLELCTHVRITLVIFGEAATEHTSVVRIWLQKANRLECHVVGNSELAAILEIPEAVREGHQGCDGQSMNEWMTMLSLCTENDSIPHSTLRQNHTANTQLNIKIYFFADNKQPGSDLPMGYRKQQGYCSCYLISSLSLAVYSLSDAGWYLSGPEQ